MEDAFTGAGNRRVTRSDDCLPPSTIVHAVYSHHHFARNLGEAHRGDAETWHESVVQSPAAVCKD